MGCARQDACSQVWWAGRGAMGCCACRAKHGRGPDPAPRWVGGVVAQILQWVGPKGLEFGRYSIEYHYIRNWLYAVRHMGARRAERHTPTFARHIIASYDAKGEISRRCARLWPSGHAGASAKL